MHNREADGAVKKAGIEMGEIESLGELAPDGALAARGGPIDGDDGKPALMTGSLLRRCAAAGGHWRAVEIVFLDLGARLEALDQLVGVFLADLGRDLVVHFGKRGRLRTCAYLRP